MQKRLNRVELQHRIEDIQEPDGECGNCEEGHRYMITPKQLATLRQLFTTSHDAWLLDTISVSHDGMGNFTLKIDGVKDQYRDELFPEEQESNP